MFTPEQQEMLAESAQVRAGLIADSRAILEQYPRHLLGTLATDIRMLAVVDAKLRYLHTSGLDETTAIKDVIFDRLRSEWMPIAQEVLPYRGLPHTAGYDYHDQAAAEVYFWWSTMPDDEMHDRLYVYGTAMDGTSITSVENWVEKMSYLYNNQAALPYFEIGILDVHLIKHALAEGIDAELAKEVYSND